MSPSGLVMTRDVNDGPGPVVCFWTMLPPTNRSFALVVVAKPLSGLRLLPCPAAVTSTGFDVAMPLYSAMRTSAFVAGVLNVIVTVLAFAADAPMLAA